MRGLLEYGLHSAFKNGSVQRFLFGFKSHRQIELYNR